MDMSNTSSAGPSRGLLDILFGDGKDEKSAEEQFKPLLALAIALEKSQTELKMKQAELQAMQERISAPVQETPALSHVLRQDEQTLVPSEEGQASVLSHVLGQEGQVFVPRQETQVSVPVQETPALSHVLRQDEQTLVPSEEGQASVLSHVLGQEGQVFVPRQETQVSVPVQETPALNHVLRQDEQTSVPGEEGESIEAATTAGNRSLSEELVKGARDMKHEAANILNQIRSNPAAILQMNSSDRAQVMKMIEDRMSQLREQMPQLEKLEKAIARDGIEKVMSVGSVSEIVQKLEKADVRTGISTEEYLQLEANGKMSNASRSNSFTENRTLPADRILSADGALPVDGALPAVTKLIEQSPTIDLGRISTVSVRRSFMPEAVRAVEFLATDGGGEMKINLNPKEIGPVELQVKSDANRVRVQMVVESHELADAIRVNKEQLIDSLKDQKIQITNIDITVKANATNSDSNFANNSDSSGFGEDRSDGQGNLGHQTRDQSDDRSFEEAYSDELDSSKSLGNRPDQNRLIDLEV